MKPTFNRRQIVLASAACGIGLAHAQTFPDRALTLVVPAPPGGTADFAARMLQEPLSKALGQSVVIDNKGGGNGAIGAQAVIGARPDGHTLLLSFSGFLVMTPHMVKLPYDPMKDLQPVCNVLTAPQVLVVRGTLTEVNTVQDLIAYAKRNPGRLNYASAGNGSVQHITAELFKAQTGTFMTHIPYRGTGPMLQDLLANNVDLMMTTAPPLVQHINAGRIKALVVSAKERLSSLPNVPAAPQVGLPNFEVSSWFAVHTHAQAPKANVERLAAEIQKIMATPSFKERALSQGAFADFMNPAQLLAFQTREYERWGKVIRDGKIKAD